MKTAFLISFLCQINELKDKMYAYAESLNDYPVLKDLYIKSVLEEEKKSKQFLYSFMKWEN